MKRRNFLKKSSVLGAAPFVLNGVSFTELFGNHKMMQLAKASRNDKVLVIIELYGGNDGLNSVIPINQLSQYYQLRSNIAIAENDQIILDQSGGILDNQQIAFHPDMEHMKHLYDEGKLAVVQNVGYENMNGSHFESRDTFDAGVGANESVGSGWIGRFLLNEFTEDLKNKGVEGYLNEYPNLFPNTDVSDPLGLDFTGGDVSLSFHTDTTPAGLSIHNPNNFIDTINQLIGYEQGDVNGFLDERGLVSTGLKGTFYEEAMNWILSIEKSSPEYAENLKKRYNAGSPTAVYYSNSPITGPLQTIARLIHGGCQSKVYLVRMGGFDTHAGQSGTHAYLLRSLAESMYFFQGDLLNRGLEDRVLGITTSEFGRRAYSNSAYGTDHGTVSPMFVFGKGVNPGIKGYNADISAEKLNQNGGNLSTHKDDIIDYRFVLNSVIQDWFEVPENEVLDYILPSLTHANAPESDTFVKNKKVSIVGNAIDSQAFLQQNFQLKMASSNPVTNRTVSVEVFMNYNSVVNITLISLNGSQAAQQFQLLNKDYESGTHQITFSLPDHLMPGYYQCIVKTPMNTQQLRLSVV